MSRAGHTSLAVAAVVAAGAGGYWAGQRDLALPDTAWVKVTSWLKSAAGPWVESTILANASPAPSGAVIYYRDPDGKPVYSATPRRTVDGRDFEPIRASEDVSFDGKRAIATEPPPPRGKPAAAGASKRILYYRNPMGLPDTSPVPKKDSMGMDYIPVYEGEGEEDASVVKVAPGKLQRTGVRSEAAAERPIVSQIRVPGSVQLDERRISVVATRADAFIEEVADVTTGDRVAKDQPLVRLYSPEITAVGAQFLTDLGSADSKASGGARQRLENLGVPAETVAEIERTRKVPLSIAWRSPRDGIVLERNAINGMKTGSGDVLFRLADISMMWVIADVPEYELSSVKIGSKATVRVRSMPGRTFEGRVALIYPQIAAETRTTRVRIELANPDGVLLPDMYADVVIANGSENPVVTVPDSAVIDTGTRQLVILDKGDGRFEPREIGTGQQGGGFTEIRSGIASGDRVVVSANFLIDAESNLKAALSAMTAVQATP
ncbi:efflux transporter periplasmic adaptor subunit [Mesorhizobium loti]|uniref:Efflux transporter periplasmic adaptor subunit n=1 Tax=Rhizobium loti TaxID=381 RepID=A0A117N388_RHILI|nr:efflux transporter periplasmic adaptor subunit [Mesorhizobium loti]